MEIGKKIEELRERKRLSKAKLAELCGFSNRQMIYSYENGKAKPSVENLTKIAEVLGVDLSYFTSTTVEPVVDDWKMESYKNMKMTVETLKSENEKLWALLNNVLGKASVANFLNAPNLASAGDKIQPSKVQLGDYLRIAA